MVCFPSNLALYSRIRINSPRGTLNLLRFEFFRYFLALKSKFSIAMTEASDLNASLTEQCITSRDCRFSNLETRRKCRFELLVPLRCSAAFKNLVLRLNRLSLLPLISLPSLVAAKIRKPKSIPKIFPCLPICSGTSNVKSLEGV